MNKKISKIKLYIKNKKEAKRIADIVKNKLQENGFLVVDNNYDLALSIGGDGTFIKMIHESKFNNKLLYAGINAGSLGYLIDFEIDDIDNFINLLKNNTYYMKESSVLETKLINNYNIDVLKSFNEVIIKSNNQLLLYADVYIDDTLLEHFTGDGLLISTPNGSTAYNLSYGGSIIDNKLKALSLTGIAPLNNKIYHSLINNLIVSSNRILKIKFNNNENIEIINDGKIININSVKEIEFNLDNSIELICSNKNDLASKINKKIIN